MPACAGMTNYLKLASIEQLAALEKSAPQKFLCVVTPAPAGGHPAKKGYLPSQV
jgi:hypothetical protein